jgi:hypothetical protein
MSGSNATFGVDGISFSNFVGVVNVEFDNIYFNNGTLNAKIAPLGATDGQVLAFNTGSSSYVPSNIPIDSLSDVVITSPTDGQVLKYNTATSLWTNASAGGGASITVSDTPPVSPTAGALWFESDSGLTFIYYDSQWIEIGAGASYDPITRIVQAKGDLILGTASQTVDRLTVGTDSQRLIANSSASTGVSWASDSTNTVIDAKGDLLVGATNDVVAKLPVGTTGQVLTADATATNGIAWATPVVSFRNKIINGGFDIWQRGTSFSANGTFPADRWLLQIDGSGATRAVGQQSFTVGNTITGQEPKFYLRYNQSVAGTGATFNILDQRIEDVRTLAGQQVTVSFWAKADATRTINSSIQQVFDGSAEVAGLQSGTITLSTSWTRYSYTGTLASIAGKTVGANSYAALRFNLPLNSTFVIDLWGVQVEAGSIATPFEQRPIGVELSLCQRYYYRLGNTSVSSAYLVPSNNIVYSASAVEGCLQHPVPMRTSAVTLGSNSVYAYNAYQGNWVGIPRAAISSSNSTTHAVIVTDRSGGTSWSTFVTGTTQMAFALIANTSAGYIEVSAEL